MTSLSKKEKKNRYLNHIRFWKDRGINVTFEMVKELAEECDMPEPNKEEWEEYYE